MAKKLSRKNKLYSRTIKEGPFLAKVIHPDGREERLRRAYRRLQLVENTLVLASEDEWRVLPETAAVMVCD